MKRLVIGLLVLGGVIGSEFFDGQQITMRGSFRAPLTRVPPARA